jgi:hypothetical protein
MHGNVNLPLGISHATSLECEGVPSRAAATAALNDIDHFFTLVSRTFTASFLVGAA